MAKKKRKKQQFFSERREWSQRKHDIFKKYTEAYAIILTKYRGAVYLVDGFAGAGRYQTDAGTLLGSPLLAAQIATDLAAKGTYNLQCITDLRIDC